MNRHEASIKHYFPFRSFPEMRRIWEHTQTCKFTANVFKIWQKLRLLHFFNRSFKPQYDDSQKKQDYYYFSLQNRSVCSPVALLTHRWWSRVGAEAGAIPLRKITRHALKSLKKKPSLSIHGFWSRHGMMYMLCRLNSRLTATRNSYDDSW